MIGLNIKEFLAREGKRLGLRNQEDLSEKLGVSDQTVSNWAKGKTFPTHQMEQQLLEMGMTVEELFGKAYLSSVRESHDALAKNLATVFLNALDKNKR